MTALLEITTVKVVETLKRFYSFDFVNSFVQQTVYMPPVNSLQAPLSEAEFHLKENPLIEYSNVVRKINTRGQVLDQ